MPAPNAPLSPEEQEKLVKRFEQFFRMMDSSQAGEAEAAFKKAYELRPKIGLTFGDMLEMVGKGSGDTEAEQLRQQMQEYVDANGEMQQANDILLRENDALRQENQHLRDLVSTQPAFRSSPWQDFFRGVRHKLRGLPNPFNILPSDHRKIRVVGIMGTLSLLWIILQILPSSPPQQGPSGTADTPPLPTAEATVAPLTKEQVTQAFNTAAQKAFATQGYTELKNRQPQVVYGLPPQITELNYIGKNSAGHTVDLTAQCTPTGEARQGLFSVSCSVFVKR